MSDYTFERESRTSHSEAYVVEESGEPVARVDLHFTPGGIVHGTLCVPQDFEDDDIEDLVGEIDERLVLPAYPFRDDLSLTVWRGVHVGVYSEEDDEDEADGDEVSTNGA